jgi:serine/threonine protein kinase
MQTLQPNATLQGGKYIIKKVLGQGGFGITYLAEHNLLGTKVAIKEFFMKDFCNREEMTSHVSVVTEGGRVQVSRFREKFLKEARNIARLHHPNIVRISDVFEENGTAYYVMDYCEGGSLADLVKNYPTGMGEARALKYIRQVASALQYIHEKNMNHLDVKPANILLDSYDNAILIDFGLSKQYDLSGGQTSTTPVGISHGYAPIEQYRENGIREFSPETDIYALGATFYKLVTGLTPPSANDILNDGLPPFPSTLSQKICKSIELAMQPRKKDRPQSLLAFLKLLGVEILDINILGYKDRQKKELICQIEMKRKELEKLGIEKDQIVQDEQEIRLKLAKLLQKKDSIISKYQSILDIINNIKNQIQQIDKVDDSIFEEKVIDIATQDTLTKNEFEQRILNANYSYLQINEADDMLKIINDLLSKGYKAEAGKYYMDNTGLGVDDAIDYISYLEEKEDRTLFYNL